MGGGDWSQMRDDEGGLTAVIEFLSAFTLFLMILTAFMSLAQLEMGSNDTCLLYTSPSPRDVEESRMPSSA